MLSCFVSGAIIGFVVATLRRDRFTDGILEAQMKRGDYWFNKYQAVIRDEWTSMYGSETD